MTGQAIVFIITRAGVGYALSVDGAALDLAFASAEAAADMAVRFAQDCDAPRYSILYP